MRILHLNHTSTVSGAEHSLLTLIAVLRERHDVLLAAPDGDLLSRARALGVPVVVVRGTSAGWRLHPLRTPRAIAEIVRAGLDLRRVARDKGIEVIHANSLRAGLIASIARRTGGPRFVVHVRDRVGTGRAARAVKAIQARRAARIIAVSDFVAAEWEGERSARVKLARIHNPVDCEVFRPDAEDGRRWRAQARIPLEAPLLAVVGQISPWKRQALAIETFAELLTALPDAQLVVVGEVKFADRGTGFDNPAYLTRLLDLRRQLGLEAGVHFLGERADVASILRAADVLLAPALDEPFGRSVGEAMATGTPAIIAARGGSIEFLRDGLDGVVAGSDAGWVEACQRALALARDTELAAGRRERACSLLSKDAHADAVERVLLDAAA